MINRTNLDYIIALHAMQPATANLVAFHTKQNNATAAGNLVELVRLGLATRRKFDPMKRAPLTDHEIEIRRRWKNGGIIEPGEKWPRQAPTGKRPYLYELTPAAATAAEHLGEALATLEWEIANNDRQQPQRRTA